MTSAKDQLNEMNQFMDIVRDNAQINERFGEIELGGRMHPQHRVPIEFYDEFKATYPGSRVRFRGPKRGKQNTSYSDATHFYIVSKKGEAPAPRDEPSGMRSPHRPEDRPHTPGYNKLSSGSRAAADSRAQAFIFDDVNEDEGQRNDEVNQMLDSVEMELYRPADPNGDVIAARRIVADRINMFREGPSRSKLTMLRQAVNNLTDYSYAYDEVAYLVQEIEGIYDHSLTENDAECDACYGLGRKPSGGADCEECGGTGNCPKLEESMASMLFDATLILGFVGWATVVGVPKVKKFLKDRNAQEIIKDFEENFDETTIEKYASDLEAKLKSTHPSSKKALYGRLQTIRKIILQTSEKDTGHAMMFHLERLQREMKKVEQFVRKSNKGVADRKRKNKRAAVGEDSNDELYYGEEEEAAYDELKASISREQILIWMEDYELVDSTAKIDDAVYDWFITKYIGDGVENFDGEQWHNWLADFVADNRAITEQEISLSSIVESVLEDFPGQPKDYEVAPEDKEDELDIGTETAYNYDDVEDEELGLRFD